MNIPDITYEQYGEFGILISLPQKIDESVLEYIILIKELLLKKDNDKLQDITNGYCSILLIYKKTFLFNEELAYLKNVISISLKESKKIFQPNFWTIPVCYHESFGLDLKSFSQSKKMSIEQIINIHTSSNYKLYCKGFLPGFMYLGGMNPKLNMQRKKEPRLRVPKKTVAIGGQQTGIYPCESPGGWHLIGKTPLVFFDIHKKPFSEIKVGDTIIFKEISLSDYLELESKNTSLKYYNE